MPFPGGGGAPAGLWAGMRLRGSPLTHARLSFKRLHVGGIASPMGEPNRPDSRVGKHPIEDPGPQVQSNSTRENLRSSPPLT